MELPAAVASSVLLPTWLKMEWEMLSYGGEGVPNGTAPCMHRSDLERDSGTQGICALASKGLAVGRSWGFRSYLQKREF